MSVDLFGQVPVTWPEIYAWCREVAGLEPDNPRTLAYIRQWNVPAKVADAKRAAPTWPPGESSRHRPGAPPRTSASG